jgi:hypothetical protein
VTAGGRLSSQIGVLTSNDVPPPVASLNGTPTTAGLPQGATASLAQSKDDDQNAAAVLVSTSSAPLSKKELEKAEKRLKELRKQRGKEDRRRAEEQSKRIKEEERRLKEEAKKADKLRRKMSVK